MTLIKTATFKYTFPITKSEERAGNRYIMGYASGPEVDTEGERMAPEAIERFAAQIISRSEGEGETPLVYRDAHAPDGVLRDLGEITNAWVTEKFHLGIEVKLDNDNPASDFLWKSVKKGKQYGMSISGRVLDYADEFLDSVGQVVRTYKDVVLDEISNTTRPAWYPSFGSVLSKSVKDAASAAPDKEGNEVDPEKDTTLPAGTEDATKSDETVTDADTTVVDSTDKSYSDGYDASSAAYVVQSIISLMTGNPGDAELQQAYDLMTTFMSTKVAAIPETDKSEEVVETTDDVDKAGRSISATNGQKLIGLYNEMAATLTDLGLLETVVEGSEKSDSTDEEDTLDKSTEDTTGDGHVSLETQIETLAKANSEQAARIAELEKAPRTQLPGVITDETHKSQESDLLDLLSKADVSTRLRAAFALQTQGK